jgi:hypothetical protein
MRTLVCVALAACGPTSAPTSCRDAIAPGQLVITEVFATAEGADPGKQWFEIYSASEVPLSLDGLAIIHARPDGSQARIHHVRSLAIAPSTYRTFGDAEPDHLPPYVDYSYASDLGLFHSGGGRLELRCGAIAIDAAPYGDAHAGHARELGGAPPDAHANDDPARWCEASATEFVAGSFGTPGQESDCTPLTQGQCSDGGRARDVTPPLPGQLVITEVMTSPREVPDSAGEWFEVQALADVDLNGLGLDRDRDSQAPEVLGAPTCLRVRAGERALFARDVSAAANGGLPSVTAPFFFTLVSGSTPAPGVLRLLSGDTIIDAVRWTDSRAGKALQLDPMLTDGLSNDDPASFCDATIPYGLGDLGTPGAPNLPCASTPLPGMCAEGGAPRVIVRPPPGQLRITEVMPNPHVEPAQEWFEIQNAGPTEFDLNELALDRAGDTRAPDAIHAVECKPLAPGAYAVFARSADPATNGGLPAVDATFGFALVNAAGDVRVLDGERVLDAVTWSASVDGVSQQLVPVSCPGVTPYGDGDNRGTPRAANTCR